MLEAFLQVQDTFSSTLKVHSIFFKKWTELRRLWTAVSDLAGRTALHLLAI